MPELSRKNFRSPSKSHSPALAAARQRFRIDEPRVVQLFHAANRVAHVAAQQSSQIFQLFGIELLLSQRLR